MKYNCAKIEAIIGYAFNNKKLLRQAFTRISYSNEKGGENNEVLEFIGDKVLDFVVVCHFANCYGKVTNNGYVNSKNEGYLTKLKSVLVDSDALSAAIDRLCLYEFLLIGNSDKNNKGVTKSMKEDLFEAIVGAVAIDSNWDMNLLYSFTLNFLGIGDENKKDVDKANYIGMLQEWLDKNRFESPEYSYELQEDEDGIMWVCFGKIKELNIKAHAIGKNKKEARQNVAEALMSEIKVVNYIVRDARNVYAKAIGKPKEEEALHQLNRLVQGGLISKPDYSYYYDFDINGNTIWTCECRVDEITEYYFTNDKHHSLNKKTAQRNAVYNLLRYLVKK